MARTASQQIADAKAENYWSAVQRRNEKRRAARAELKSRPICVECKTQPVEPGRFSVLCKADADEYRRLFGQDSLNEDR
jgi:predicted ATPase